MSKLGKRLLGAAKEARGTVASAENARQVLIDELGDVELVDTLLMKLRRAGFKLVPIGGPDDDDDEFDLSVFGTKDADE